MPLTIDQFSQQVTSSGLITENELRSFLETFSEETRPADGEALARELVRQRKLTKFQAAQVYAGKGTALTLGNYVILDKLGQGGMGMVLKAEHKRMGRIVALKVMAPAAMKSPEAVKRFHREVQAAAKLTHPNIVIAYDADEANGTHFLVMEYVEGADLSALVKKQGPLPVGKTVECIRQAANGLKFAHEQGIVHRDIKPANLLVDSKGTVKILDMGLARIEGDTSANAELTHTGAVMGTVDYMAPEQALNTKSADARSDIYSLGISLWYMLTGKAAYDGDSLMSRLLAHRDAPIPSLCMIRSDVPPALDAVFQKMVAKQAKDRFQSMTEVLQALETLPTSGQAGAAENSQLSAFLNKLDTQPARPTTVGRSAQQTGSGVSNSSVASEATFVSGDLAHGTSLKLLDNDASPGPGTVNFWKQRRNQVMAGVAGLALLLMIPFFRSGNRAQPEPKAVTTAKKSPGSSSSATKSVSSPKAEGLGSGSTGAPPLAKAPFDAAQARAHQEAWAKHLGVPVEYTNSIGMKFVLVPPGEFTMGMSKTDAESQAVLRPADMHWTMVWRSSSPEHRVRLTQPFYLGVHEVTQEQYQRIIGKNPSHFSANGEGREKVLGTDTRQHPVEMISYVDAAQFCIELSKQESLPSGYSSANNTVTSIPGDGYRLPSEAEWEYACRAGTSTSWFHGNDQSTLGLVAWIEANSDGKTHPVGQLRANSFGLFDMHGNVWEWCEDTFEALDYERRGSGITVNPRHFDSGGSRVLRGGYWFHLPYDCRSGQRFATSSADRLHLLGFRLSLSVDAMKQRGAQKDRPAPEIAVAPFDATQARAHQEAWAKHLGSTVETTNSTGQKMILIPPGEFLMGSSDEQVKAALQAAAEVKADRGVLGRIETAERPQHLVVISRPLRISATEVTIGQFRRFVEASKYVTEAEQYGFGDSSGKLLNDKVTAAQKKMSWHAPGYAVNDDSPVAQITWHDAMAYCKWLSEQEQQNYRLPTEAEWEFACRSGTTTQYSFGDDYRQLPKYGWPIENSVVVSHPVGKLAPNSFGLFDMHGNLYEWCSDYFDVKSYSTSPSNDPQGPSEGAARVLRGGSVHNGPLQSRSASRYSNIPSSRFNDCGFRVVAEVHYPPTAIAPFDARQARAHQEAWAKHLGRAVETINSIGQKMILIPPGEFLMGSSDGQISAAVNSATKAKSSQKIVDRMQKAERPQHRVVLTRPFLMSATEVTVGEYKKFSATGYLTDAEKAAQADPKVPTYLRPGYPVADDSPAALLTWGDANAFCEWLSTQEKKIVRLPTEAEWEYACRAGSVSQYSFGDDESDLPKYAWFKTNAGDTSHPVGTLSPNPFGLFDMHGHLFEWCGDWFDDSYYQNSPLSDPTGPSSGTERVLRGGRWGTTAVDCRSAFRHCLTPASRYNGNGFRIVQELDTAPGTTAVLWIDWLGPKMARGDFDSNPNGWIKEGTAFTTDLAISGLEVIPLGTRDAALRLTYLLRDSKGILINARDAHPDNTDASRRLYVAQDDGQQLAINTLPAGGQETSLIRKPIPDTIRKDMPRTLEFRVVGNTLTATLNGTLVLTVEDSTIPDGNFAIVALKGVLIQKVEYQIFNAPATTP